MRAQTPDKIQNTMLRSLHKLTGMYRVAVIAWLIIVFMIILPMVAVIVNSFLARSTRSASLEFSLIQWQRLLGTTVQIGHSGGSAPILALWRSMVLGIISAVLSTTAATAGAWYVATNTQTKWNGKWVNRIIESAMALPLGVSSIVLGLGWLLLLGYLPHTGFFRITALSATHSLISLPFYYRLIAGRLKQISARVVHAARISGANRVKTFFLVEVPMTRQALITSAVFALALFVGELNATAILAPGDFSTVPLAMYRMVGTYNFGGACVQGSLLILLCSIAFFLIDRFAEE